MNFEVECLESENLCGWVWGSYSQQKQEAELLTAISLYEKRLSESDINNASGEVRGHGLFNFGLWLSSIVMVALGIIWGLVSMGFSALNAGVFSVTAVVIYVVLYYVDLKQNILTEEDIVELWTVFAFGGLDKEVKVIDISGCVST
ncbi:hypothetical protein CAPTEDRAFT_195645 [Capitella teleta]|uniref:Uncharacterized protein n=1 Tax=Capitella teleta TaxID=283909 RepID=X1ZVB5_CAPTE|nr:hypothetical protein CAPTEDRAFT_195645 [Capitella teleta]|eukprot:ELT88360.1 hypothetical protein CAPTEDRAFT_195645 [Capitella teleta]